MHLVKRQKNPCQLLGTTDRDEENEGMTPLLINILNAVYDFFKYSAAKFHNCIFDFFALFFT